MTNDINETDPMNPMDIVNRLRRIVNDNRSYGNHQIHCLEAADEIELLRAENAQLRVERDRWRKIADDFSEAGTHPTAHNMVVRDYGEACRGWGDDDRVAVRPVGQSRPLRGRFEGSPLVDVLSVEREVDRRRESR